jgi:chromate transport protein ChrA
MGKPSASKFIWVPRVLAGMLIVLFLALSLDAFNGSGSVMQQVLAFAMQSLPALAIAFLLALSWKAPRLAGILFVVLAVFFTVFFSTYRSPFTFVAISLMPVFVGACFLFAASKRG